MISIIILIVVVYIIYSTYIYNINIPVNIPIKENYNNIKKQKRKSNNYLHKHLQVMKKLDQSKKQDIPTPSSNKYNDDFFSFRDFTQINSSVFKDPVDKANNLVLEPDNNKDKKIKDIYDSCTKSYNLYDQPFNVKSYDNKDDNYDSYMDLDVLYGIKEKI